ncbi:MAG: phosphotransferase [Deltaproteobacteria bacterium]|nr:phosphotransferase [Deltaproteobacteria bacterium]
MRHPECLATLVDLGIIQEVVRPLMSGKEAQIYLVVSDDELRVAKVYKTAQNRSFRQRAEYTEGRAVRNTRTQRAMSKRSRFGRAQDEASWRSAEVDIIYRLHAAGVRVPEPYQFIDGILVMELITGPDGDPAPRLADVTLDRAEAGAVFATLLSAVVKMLSAGVVHGDLSEFNVLMSHDGPVVIDFPQAVDPARNQNARKLLFRDVDNLNQILLPGQRRLRYGPELWNLYSRSELTADTQLTGRYKSSAKKADTEAVLREVESAAQDAERRREAEGPSRRRRRRGGGGAQPAHTPVVEMKNPPRGVLANHVDDETTTTTPEGVPAARNQSTPKRDTPRRDTPKRDTPRRDTPKRDTPRRDTPRRNSPRRNAHNQSAPRDNRDRDNTRNQGSPRDNRDRDNTRNQGSPRDNTRNQGSPRDNTRNQGSPRDNTRNQGSPRDNTRKRNTPEVKPATSDTSPRPRRRRRGRGRGPGPGTGPGTGSGPGKAVA